MMPCASPSIMKPKIGFSIESLVGAKLGGPQNAPPASPPSAETPLSRSHSFLSSEEVPLATRALLALEAKSHAIQRPQPINRAVHRAPPLDATISLPPTADILTSKLSLHPALLPHHINLSALSQLPTGLPSQFNPLVIGGGVPGLGAPLPREYPLYPWLLSRHGRVFPHGLPSPEQLAYLLQPFRKPKRIRTAFSPSQLLKLEQAFEKNQYVVGAERKQLAQVLNLSETQVKVWFQNRRTKEKRIQQEEEEGGNSGEGPTSSTSESSHQDSKLTNTQQSASLTTLPNCKAEAIQRNHIDEVMEDDVIDAIEEVRVSVANG